MATDSKTLMIPALIANGVIAEVRFRVAAIREDRP
jgi:hypothetical protein